MADTAFGEIKLLKTNKQKQTETEKTPHTHEIQESNTKIILKCIYEIPCIWKMSDINMIN